MTIFNSFLAFILIALSFLPSFSFKADLEQKIKTKIVGQSQVATTEENKDEIKLNNIPEKKLDFVETSVFSEAAIFVDRESKTILFEKNKDKKLPMASTTKLMTALIAVEKLNPDEVLEVPTIATRPLDSIVGLQKGDKLTVRELLHGLLIESGADAALTLSQHIGGDENRFAALMNERGALLGLKNTQFSNSVGYDSSNNHSTASDLAKLGEIALSNSLIAEIVKKNSHTIKTENGKSFYLNNTNRLLPDSRYQGIKTGTTYAAGECLISFYKEEEQEFIGVVLASPSRFYETDKVVNWIKNSYSWQ